MPPVGTPVMDAGLSTPSPVHKIEITDPATTGLFTLLS